MTSPRRPGSYLLVFILDRDISCCIGKRGLMTFPQGTYVYVGSALNGLDQRIRRHLRTDKKIHWHIDYLLPHAQITTIYYTISTE